MSFSRDIDRQLAVIRQEVAAAARALHNDLVQMERRIMAKIDDEAAAVAANTAAIKQIGVNVTAAIEGHETIQEEIDALKAAIAAAGTPVDTTALDVAVADQTTALNAVAALVSTPPATT